MEKHPLCSPRLFSLEFGNFMNLKEIFACMWLEMWDKFTYFKCKVASSLQLAHSSMESMQERSTIEFIPIYWILLIFLTEFDWSKICLGRMKHDILLCNIPSLNHCNLKIQNLNHTHFTLETTHSPCFKTRWTNLVLTSERVHEKFHNQHRVKRTQDNQPSYILGKLGVKQVRTQCTHRGFERGGIVVPLSGI